MYLYLNRMSCFTCRRNMFTPLFSAQPSLLSPAPQFFGSNFNLGQSTLFPLVSPTSISDATIINLFRTSHLSPLAPPRLYLSASRASNCTLNFLLPPSLTSIHFGRDSVTPPTSSFQHSLRSRLAIVMLDLFSASPSC